MSPALRLRTERLSYSATLDIGGGKDAVPLNAMMLEQDADSGSGWILEALKTFLPPTMRKTKTMVSKTMPNQSLASRARPVNPLPQVERESQIPKTQWTGAPHAGPYLRRSSSNKMYSLPTVSIHHRHHAVPLYFPAKRVE
ncbi:hypothetical protein FIBSPDRAFT_953767 [Athelia psychrophila]|uniref:Uncharacterized protein n=1 Tax=Athelia psychrophila TaxID=1759441 RepID=A0A166JVL8_9AGAM|nr:hypothetical protein FIBSPDRAFT_953767 [Fibularhizoctonia sp. CBS 109695]